MSHAGNGHNGRQVPEIQVPRQLNQEVRLPAISMKAEFR